MPTVIEQQTASNAEMPFAKDAQAEAIAQRLAQFRDTMALIHSMPDHRAEAGLGPLPDNAVELSYDDCAGICL